MARQLKIMGVHGLGDHRSSPWKEEWQATISRVFENQGEVALEFCFVDYDDLFDKVDLSVWETLQAVAKLTSSAVSTTLSGRRGLISGISEKLRWTAGYVVAWLEDEQFKKQTRKRVLDAVSQNAPDIILAHSLGSLLTYNAFTHGDAAAPKVSTALGNARYVSLGSQIGNPFVVRNLTNGRIEPLPVREWYHLYNEHDDVFTAPIRLWEANNFRQVQAPFDIEGLADHQATEYLKHRNTIDQMWWPLLDDHASRGKSLGARPPRKPARRKREPRKPGKRALLVGINNYPNAQDRLEGCVNDVFLMSSVLQECGFPPESIRVCLDERATAKGILERLHWLLDEPRADEERVFYYSGHGARIPEYGENFEPDRQTEALVPWDFDWSPEHAVIDDQIYSLYSQLPYDTRFAMILDCCHAGGLHRQGGGRIRGLNPPDDIRHRELKWDSRSDMWVPRDFTRINPRFSSDAAVNKAYFGANGSTARIGRASRVRSLSQAEYRRDKKQETVVGPYLPLVIEACGEAQYSYEYRHGASSYGAFTYAFSKHLRRAKRISFQRLVDETRGELAELGYEQTPQILGPRRITAARVPWQD